MTKITPIYLSGEEIKDGDLIQYEGEDGSVEFAITENSPGWSTYWKELGQGVMLILPSFGRLYVPFADEDLTFVSRKISNE